MRRHMNGRCDGCLHHYPESDLVFVTDGQVLDTKTLIALTADSQLRELKTATVLCTSCAETTKKEDE